MLEAGSQLCVPCLDSSPHAQASAIREAERLRTHLGTRGQGRHTMGMRIVVLEGGRERDVTVIQAHTRTLAFP